MTKPARKLPISYAVIRLPEEKVTGSEMVTHICNDRYWREEENEIHNIIIIQSGKMVSVNTIFPDPIIPW